MLELTFELITSRLITKQRTKFNYVLAHLLPHIPTVIRDEILHPDRVNPYQDLKSKVIERCSETKRQEIRQLQASLGNRKPREVLRIMKRRAENYNINDSFLFELFMQAMPVSVVASQEAANGATGTATAM